MKLKRVVTGCLMGAMVIALTACGGEKANSSVTSASKQEESSAAEAEGKALKIGFTANSLDNDTVQQSLEGLQAVCDKNGWEITPIDYKQDLSICINTIENFTTAGSDIIIFQCPDAEGVEDVVKRAQEEGVIVVAYDTTATYFDYYLSQSDEEIGAAIGKMAADYVNKNLNGEATAVAIGLPSNPILLTREQAFTKAFEENCKGKVVDSLDVSKFGGDNAGMAETIISAHPETSIVLSIADTINIAMMDTFKAQGYSNTDGKFAMFGCDCVPETLSLWKGESGDDMMVQGSVWTGLPDALLDALDRAANNVLKGEKGEAKIHQNVTAVTPENFSEIFK